jgi:sulfoxide reductase heme-binding subunit YedZ
MPAWISRGTSRPAALLRRLLQTGLLMPLTFALCAAPALRWSIAFARGTLGPDPIAALTHASGWWAMSLLLATLAVTPLRRLSVWLSRTVALRFGRRIGDWNALIRQRRQLGLWSFGYAVVHCGLYLGFDAGTLSAYAQDLAERPFIALGSAALLLLLPLALTSTQWAIRRLKRHWLRLHRLVYAAAVLAALHGVLQAKLGHGSAWVFAGSAAALLAFRLVAGVMTSAATAAASAARAAESAAPAARRCGEARPACDRRPRPPSGTSRRSHCS